MTSNAQRYRAQGLTVTKRINFTEALSSHLPLFKPILIYFIFCNIEI